MIGFSTGEHACPVCKKCSVLEKFSQKYRIADLDTKLCTPSEKNLIIVHTKQQQQKKNKRANQFI